MKLDGFYGKRICVAVSGGVDSVVLLHYLQERAEKYGYLVCATHMEHGIRGAESVDDMRFTQELCARWGVPLFVFRENCLEKAKTDKESLETVARNFRYEKFRELITTDKTDYIALAHHQNDEAETVLFRLARGTSLTGARGMKEESGRFLRPLLSWKKSEIIDYAKERGLAYCVDKTNFERDATRNKLRLEVLPALENAVPGAIENLARFALLAGEDDEYLYGESQKLLKKEGDGRFVVAFSDCKPLFRRACLTAIKALGIEKDYTARHLEDAFVLQKAERGAYLCLPKNLLAEKTLHGIAFFLKKEKEFTQKKKPLAMPFNEKGFDGGRYLVKVELALPKERAGDWKVLKLDLDKLPKSATFRFREEGDEIKTFGGTTKSLKKYFNEKKIPVSEREWLPLIAEKDGGKVYAVCGVEIAEEVKVTSDTKRVAYLTIEKR